MISPGSSVPLAPEVAALTATLAQMPIAVMITDTHGVVVWKNRACEELPENITSPSSQLLCQVLETGEGAQEHVVAGQSMSSNRRVEHSVQQTVTPVRDTGGAISHALWTFHATGPDKNELERMENIFSEAQLAAHFGVFRWDARSGTSHWTKETYKLYGLDPAVSRPSLESWLQTVHESDRERVLKEYLQMLDGPQGKLKIQYRSADGLRWIAGAGQLYRDEEGRLDHLIGINIDVTERVQLEQALKASEERLALVFEAASDGVWDWDLTTDKLDYSKRWKAILGYEEHEIGTDSAEWRDRLHPEDATGVALAWQRHAEGAESSYSTEHRLLCKDGSWKWVWCRGSVVRRSKDGAAERAVGAISDISARRLMQQELREREEKAQSLLERMNEGVAYCRLLYLDGMAHDWVCEEANPALERLTGLTQMTGKRMSELIPGFRETNPDLCPLCDRVVRTGASERVETFMEGLGAWLSVTVYSSGGSSFVAVVENITERKTAELELRKSHDLLTNLARLVPGALYQYRRYPDGRAAFPYASPGMKAIYEVDPEDIRQDASPLLGRLHPEDHDRVVQATNESERTLGMLSCEFRMVLPDQGVRWRSSQAWPERLEDGSTQWHGILLDITDRKKNEEEQERLRAQLMQAHKMESVGRLAGGVAHDFNNLLTVINGYSGLLMSSMGTTDPKHRFAEEISKAGTRAAGLTKQLVAFSRKQVTQPKTLHLNGAIREAIPLLERLIGDDIRLTTELDPGLGYTLADPDQIHQVILNLAVNARDAMPDGGELEISTANVQFSQAEALALDAEAPAGRYVRIAVTDTGKGMDEATRGHAFDPFFTTRDVEDGTGLGLSMVYGIVRQSNGWITVRSQPGSGSTFTVFLPRTEDVESDKVGRAKGRARQGTETVLIVEDQEGVRSFARAVLTGSGYQVLEAASGEESIRVAASHPGRIHLLLTDVVLPGMNGRALSEKLTEVYPGLVSIFCSGYTPDLIRRRGVMNQSAAFLQKPFLPEDLLTKVRSALDDRKHDLNPDTAKVLPFVPHLR